MKVYELLLKLLEAPAGSNVYIEITQRTFEAEIGEGILVQMAGLNSENEFTIKTK